MKLVFVNRFFAPDDSATSQLLTDLSQDLGKGGWRVEVICSRQLYSDPAASLSPAETIGDVLVHRIWSTKFGRGTLTGRLFDYLSFHLAAFVRLLDTIEPGDIVVAKTDPPLISVIALVATKLKGAKLVNWVQDLFPEVAIRLGVPLMNGFPGRAITRLRNITLRHAARNVVLGMRMHHEIRAVASHVSIIPNWADGETITPVPPGSNHLRSAWELSDRFVVGYSGNMGRAHEIEGIIEAIRHFHGTLVTFLFIGAGAQYDRLRARIASLGLQDNVLFKPYQPRGQLSFSLSAADVHLVSLNPKMEGLIVPSKFYGVCAAGRPTIFIGDIEGELARTVAECGCGYSVEPGDARSLIRRIEELSCDAGLCDVLGKKARAALESRFDRRIAAAAWSNLLGELAAPEHAYPRGHQN
jgi:colanic acid biosynthesis glycosyl transferase WcaI